MKTIQLKAFEENAPFSVGIDCSRNKKSIFVTYEVLGDISSLHLPVKNNKPEQKDFLWKETCLELFVAKKEDSSYVEFNLSPSGDFNVYFFSDYRKKKESDKESYVKILERKENASCLKIQAEFFLEDLPSEIIFSITTILKTKEQNYHYAFSHVKDRPDFHAREKFRNYE